MTLSDILKELYAADGEAQAAQVEFLSALMRRWEKSGEQPSEFDGLCSGERASILVAMKLESRLDSPLATFLMLDPHLQKWVLTARGMSNFIGTQIAGELFIS